MKYIQNEITKASAEAQLELLKNIVALLNNDTLYVDSFKQPADPYTAVDLGLSVKWANMNIGAESEEQAGLYFAWGDTEGFKVSEASGKFTNNWYSSRPGKSVSTNITANGGHDAARVNMGGTWRMPTGAELTELVNYGSRTWTTVGGVNGYKIVNKNDSGKYIFFPAVGFYNNGSIVSNYGGCWSSTFGNNSTCSGLFFFEYAFLVNGYDRYRGYFVRGVQS